MPPPDRAAALAVAAEIGLSLTDTQAERLIAYLGLLQRWNATYNLTAIREPGAMWLQHIVDCMAAVAPLQRHLSATMGSTRARILDVGSGGGLPGLVWALLLPEVEVVCVDAVAKKTAFMRQAAATLQLTNVQVRHVRVEALRDAPFDVITSRAFASLSDFTRLTRPLLAPAGRWLAMKGKPPLEELEELAALTPPTPVFHVEPLAVPGLVAERCLVWLQAPNTSTPAGATEARPSLH